MKSRILSIILSVCLFSQNFASSFCAKLADARCGEYHTLALDNHGNLWSCGASCGYGYAYNQLGLGNDISGTVYSLQRVKGLNGSGFLQNITTFDAGWFHSLAVDVNGSCYSFGSDTSGQLGNGENNGNSNVPTKVRGLNNDANGLRHIVKVAAGRSGTHSLAVDSNGYVYAFGDNGYNQCTGNEYQYQYPILVRSTGADPNYTYLGQEVFIVDVEAGVTHSLALQDLFDGGHVYEWGDGVFSRPNKVPDQNNTGYLSNIVDIATCGQSLAVDWNGYVWYWTTGTNPTRIVGENGIGYLQNIAKVAAGYGDKCVALDSSGNVWEWSGRYGTPVKITDGAMQTQSGYLENITALDAGYYDFRVAIDEYGIGWAWGSAAGAYAGIGGVSASEPVEMRCAEITSPFIVTKTDDVNGCVMPYDGIFDKIINYTICVDANGFTDLNAVLMDKLPLEVDFNSCDSSGFYDSETRTVYWDIGQMVADYNHCFHLQVKLNPNSIGRAKTTNTVELIGDNYITQQTKDSQLCCLEDIVFVKWDATGANNGSSWENAYTSIQMALQQINDGNHCASKVFVAAGTYYPTNNPYDSTATFQMLDGVDIYGHFRGCETDPNQRNLADDSYASILTSDVDNNGNGNVSVVVTAADCKIDGFTITKGNNDGIYCSGCDTIIANCVVKHNNEGIRCENGSHTKIINTFVLNSNYSGIDCSGTGTQLEIEKCTVNYNGLISWSGNDGLYARNDCSQVKITDSIFGGNCLRGINIESGQSAVIQNCDVNDNGDGIIFSAQSGTVERCNIYRNSQGIYAGTDCNIVNNIINENYYVGVYISSSVANANLMSNLIYENQYDGIYAEGYAEIRNNTIVYNDYYGIEGYGDPNINSNIIWGNTTNIDGTFTKVNYNCIQGGYAGTGNTSTPPQLDAEYCLTSASTSCIDNGNPNYVSQTNETDITGENRCLSPEPYTLNPIVDKGADEYNPYDLNFDSKINFMDFTELADDWQTAYDIFDVRNMCAYWLMGTDWPDIGGVGAEFAEVLYECPEQMMMQSVSSSIYSMGSSKLAPAISASSVIPADAGIQAESISEPVDVNSLLNWLDDLWQNDQAIRESMSESEYLEFRNAIENIE